MGTARRIGWVVALAAMPLFTLWLIARHGENVPRWDEWVMVPLFKAQDAGQFGLGEIWQQHNEHRPAVPRTIDFLQAYLTGWDLRAELYRNFAVAVAAFVLVAAALRRSLDRGAFVVASVIASILLFSTVHWENWLWGWQFEWFVCNLAVLGALWALTVVVDRSPRGGLALAIACGLVATFSLGQGLLVWPVGLAVLLLRGRPWRAWAVATVAVPIAYFVDWRDPSYLGSKTYFLDHPFGFLEYIALYVGRDLGRGDTIGTLVGAVIVLSFLAAAAYVLLRRRDRVLVERAAFWVGVGLYALGAAVITALSRAEVGVVFSRYAIMAALLAVATMTLLLVIARGERAGPVVLTPGRRRAALALVAVPLLIAGVGNANGGADGMRERGEELDRMAQCTRQARTIEDPCLRRVKIAPEPWWPATWHSILYLREKGWAGYEPLPGAGARER